MADNEQDGEEEVVPLARKKKIHVNAASLVDLKAALYRKQQEVKREKVNQTHSNSPVTKKVSDKTASIWRKPVSNRARGNVGSTTATSNKVTHNVHGMTTEEENVLARSRAALEAKAALYDKLHRGEGLDDSDDEDLDPRYMVDFQRKIYEKVVLQQQQQKESTQPMRNVRENKKEAHPDSSEEWVEYTDSFGRSRQCMKKDLPDMMKLDNDLKHVRPPSPSGRSGSRSPTQDDFSEDARQEREMMKWEHGTREETELDESSDPIHYQTVQHGEIRTHGVGYYGFSGEEEKRQKQLHMLNELRDETVDQRKRRERLKEKRKALMEARLSKVRQQKLKQGKVEVEKGEGEIKVDIADFDFDKKSEQEDQHSEGDAGVGDFIAQEVARAREKDEEEKRAKHVRPWDRGKKN